MSGISRLVPALAKLAAESPIEWNRYVFPDVETREASHATLAGVRVLIGTQTNARNRTTSSLWRPHPGRVPAHSAFRQLLRREYPPRSGGKSSLRGFLYPYGLCVWTYLGFALRIRTDGTGTINASSPPPTRSYNASTKIPPHSQSHPARCWAAAPGRSWDGRGRTHRSMLQDFRSPIAFSPLGCDLLCPLGVAGVS
jgi:hypothetical protein